METVSQYSLRFQDLYRQLGQDVSVNHLRDTFLAGLREPLRTTLALIDFSQQTIKQVVARELALDHAHHSIAFSMGTLQSALPTVEETQFRQALDCPARLHRPVCHSRVHTVENCEYNILNRVTTAPVRQIEPRANRPPLNE